MIDDDPQSVELYGNIESGCKFCDIRPGGRIRIAVFGVVPVCCVWACVNGPVHMPMSS